MNVEDSMTKQVWEIDVKWEEGIWKNMYHENNSNICTIHMPSLKECLIKLLYIYFYDLIVSQI